MKPEPLDLAIQEVGSLAELARRMKISQQRLYNWKKRGIPKVMVLAVEKASGVPRHKLDPDLYPRERAA